MATKVSTTLKVSPLGGPLVLTAEGAVVTLDGADTKLSQAKRCFVLGFTVDGHPVKMLVRLQRSGGITWLDLVASEDLATLVTRVGAMDLSTDAVGHPTPGDDLIDASALTDAEP